MKGNKKLLIVAALLLLVAVSYSTYAIYKSSAEGTGSVTAAQWHVEVNGNEIMTTAQNTFTLGTIEWDTPRVGQNNTIAPGDTGTVNITIDASTSQVSADYVVEIETTNLPNPQFAITSDSASAPLTGTIAYSTTASEMIKTIPVRITWNGVDSDTANDQDIDIAGDQLSLPIKVTVTQNPNPVSP